MVNKQIVTTWDNKNEKTLKTYLRESEIRAINDREILVEMIYVPIHGSFWLASYPKGIHPRQSEFMMDDYFVFGNGGVGRVLETKNRNIQEGDFVCIYGHVPCKHYNCYACTVLHRFTECDYNEGSIIGHGKGSYEGTYGKYVILPESSYELCYRSDEKPSREDLKPFMLGFLFADVRNALTRHTDSLRMRRMVLIGAGYSGLAAAYIHNRSCPESRIFVVDSSKTRLDIIKNINSGSVITHQLDPQLAKKLNTKLNRTEYKKELDNAIQEIREKMYDHFGGRGCNILFDGSSGNTTPLWDNQHILSPSTHCIPFGFGSESIRLNKGLIQLSGLTIMMSRGVGDIRNRKEVIELIKAGASKFINKKMIDNTLELKGIEQAAQHVYEMQHPPRPLQEIEHAYISF